VALPFIGNFWNFARDTQDLYKLQAQMKDALSVMDGRLRAVEDRLTRLESEPHQVQRGPRCRDGCGIDDHRRDDLRRCDACDPGRRRAQTA